MKKILNLYSIVLLLIGVFFRWIPFEDLEPRINDSQNSRNVTYGSTTRIIKSNTKISKQPIGYDRQMLALFTAYIVKLEEEPKIHDGERNRFELGNLFRKLSGTLLFSQNIRRIKK